MSRTIALFCKSFSINFEWIPIVFVNFPRVFSYKLQCPFFTNFWWFSEFVRFTTCLSTFCMVGKMHWAPLVHAMLEKSSILLEFSRIKCNSTFSRTPRDFLLNFWSLSFSQKCSKAFFLRCFLKTTPWNSLNFVKKRTWKDRRFVCYLQGIQQVDLSKMNKFQVFVKIPVSHSDRENSRKNIENATTDLKKARKSTIYDMPKVS